MSSGIFSYMGHVVIFLYNCNLHLYVQYVRVKTLTQANQLVIFLEGGDQGLDYFLQSAGHSNLNKNFAEQTGISNFQISSLPGGAYRSPI